MKLYAARMFGQSYRYEGHYMSVDGYDVLVCGSKDRNQCVETLEEYAENDLFDNPFMTDEQIFKCLDSMYIWDSELEEECTPIKFEEFIDSLMSEIDPYQGKYKG